MLWLGLWEIDASFMSLADRYRCKALLCVVSEKKNIIVFRCFFNVHLFVLMAGRVGA